MIKITIEVEDEAKAAEILQRISPSTKATPAKTEAKATPRKKRAPGRGRGAGLKGKPWTPARIAYLVRCYESGERVEDIARRRGYHRSTIYSLLRQGGAQMRQPFEEV